MTNRLRVIGMLCLLVPTFAMNVWAGEYKPATVKEDVIVHREAKLESDSLTRYPGGTKLKVYTPDRNGWYAVYFASPIKGSKFGWIRMDSVEVQDVAGAAATAPRAAGPAPRRTRSSSVPSNQKQWLAIRAGIQMASPSDLQVNIGDTVSGVKPIMVTGEFGMRVGSQLFLAGRLGYYKFSKLTAAAVAAGTADNYFASGFSFMAHAGMFLADSPGLQLGLGLGLGLAMNTAGNQTTVTSPPQGTVTTSNIMSTPIQAYLTMRTALGPGFFGGLELGYMLQSLKDVKVFLSPTDTDPGPSNISLSGIYGTVGFGFYL